MLRHAIFAAAMLLAACSPGQGGTATAPPADDMVILTVTGAIGETNRGPLDEFTDAFTGHKGVKYDKAHEFTRASLAALGQHEATIKRANWPRAVTVRGPMFKDVMAKVKAEGDTVILQALDGYRSTFLIASLQSSSVLLATEADGKPLAIGGRGPVWLVFPAGIVPNDSAEGDDGLAWSVYFIEVTNAAPPT